MSELLSEGNLPFLLIAVLAWVSCSSVTQLANKETLNQGTEEVFLVTSQMLLGTLLFLTKKQLKKAEENAIADPESERLTQEPLDVESDSSLRSWKILVGCCNAIGHTLTMISFNHVAAALTHLVRSSEIAITGVLAWCILSHEMTKREMFSVPLVVIGLILLSSDHFGDDSLLDEGSMRGIAFAIVAAVSVSLRNCGSSKCKIISGKKLHYDEICLFSLPFMLVASLCQVIISRQFHLTVAFSVACIFHVAYSSISFYVLGMTDPVTHSFIKLMSRVVSIIALGLVFGLDASENVLLGASLCLLGGILYTFSKVRVLYCVAVLCFCLSIVYYAAEELDLTSMWISPASESLATESINPTSESLTTKDALRTNNDTVAFDDHIVTLQAMAFKEVGLNVPANLSKNPLMPISGYRACVQIFWPGYTKPANKNLCMGDCRYDSGQSAEFFQGLNMDRITYSGEFVGFTLRVCKSTILLCGKGATALCGLTGFYTRTPVYVPKSELSTWPDYMMDFLYERDDIDAIEFNHRLLFDRHTIKSTHPLLLNRQKLPGKEFRVQSWGSKCKPPSPRSAFYKLEEWGNAGDLFGQYLGNYFAKNLNLRAAYPGFQCFDPSSNVPNFYFVGSIIPAWAGAPDGYALGIGVITFTHKTISSKLKGRNKKIFGTRGTRTRDLVLAKFGLNPEVVGDPGIQLIDVFRKEIEEARSVKSEMKDLCIISHYIDIPVVHRYFPQFKNRTMDMRGYLHKQVQFLATCRATISSSLHGAIFSHSLSIPTLVVKLSNKVAGGDAKFIDYYLGMNVTNFRGRLVLDPVKSASVTESEWIEKVKSFPQPKLPIEQGVRNRTLEIFKSLWQS